MLVLARKVGETIVIVPPNDSPIEVSVAEIRGDKVRIGFRAPESTKIYRREVAVKVPDVAEHCRTLWGDVAVGGDA